MKKTKLIVALICLATAFTCIATACAPSSSSSDSEPSNSLESSVDTSSSDDASSSEEEKYYTVTFKAEGEVVGTATYTTKDKEITEPSVPAKNHYTGAWESYDLTSGDITVNAVYTAIEYTVTFKADGVQVGEPIKYTVEDKAITEPNVPTKEHYTGKWETYILSGGNIIVNAVYTEKANVDDQVTNDNFFDDTFVKGQA